MYTYIDTHKQILIYTQFKLYYSHKILQIHFHICLVNALKHPTSGGGSHIVLLCVTAGYSRGAGVTNILARGDATTKKTISSSKTLVCFLFY